MLTEKKTLTFDEIEAQTALELPDGETPATVVVSCLAVCTGDITIQDINVMVAAAIGAQVGLMANALNVILLPLLGQGVELGCTVDAGNQNND